MRKGDHYEHHSPSCHQPRHTDIGWLNSHHTFSFGGYMNPAMMGYGPLRVINDDRVAPGGGFGTHPHQDMEIISYVVSGALEHKDSTGGGSIIKPGDIQLMRAGSGISHSEYNHSDQEAVRFLQIWIEPNKRGLQPGYEQAHIPGDDFVNKFRLLISPDGRDGSLPIAQDAELYGLQFSAGMHLVKSFPAHRKVWLQVVRGSLQVNGLQLLEGDGLAVNPVETIEAAAGSDGEALIFNLAEAS